MSKKNNNPVNWTPDLPSPEFCQTRAAATAWLYALKYEPKQNMSLLKPLLSECFPLADLDKVQAIVHRESPYEDITDELVDEMVSITHGEGFEILPWREAMLRILAIDFLATLKSPSVQMSEDGVLRVTSMLDDSLRGTTKNACQLVSGQRTRIRKSIRTLCLAALYLLQYRPSIDMESLQEDLVELVTPCPDSDFIVDEFPFTDYLDDKKQLNARGRFIICEVIKTLRQLKLRLNDLDELIQKSSKRWRISRMALVDLNILRLATYELFYEKTSQPRILINEAVEMAKVFGAEQSKNFVNGILQQLCNDNHIEVV